jgi:hypothetical protein
VLGLFSCPSLRLHLHTFQLSLPSLHHSKRDFTRENSFLFVMGFKNLYVSKILETLIVIPQASLPGPGFALSQEIWGLLIPVALTGGIYIFHLSIIWEPQHGCFTCKFLLYACGQEPNVKKVLESPAKKLHDMGHTKLFPACYSVIMSSKHGEEFLWWSEENNDLRSKRLQFYVSRTFKCAFSFEFVVNEAWRGLCKIVPSMLFCCNYVL